MFEINRALRLLNYSKLKKSGAWTIGIEPHPFWSVSRCPYRLMPPSCALPIRGFELGTHPVSYVVGESSRDYITLRSCNACRIESRQPKIHCSVFGSEHHFRWHRNMNPSTKPRTKRLQPFPLLLSNYIKRVIKSCCSPISVRIHNGGRRTASLSLKLKLKTLKVQTQAHLPPFVFPRLKYPTQCSSFKRRNCKPSFFFYRFLRETQARSILTSACRAQNIYLRRSKRALLRNNEA